MPNVLTNGKMKIGAYTFTNRKRPMICVEEGNSIVAVGSFHNADEADWFMGKLAELVGAEKENNNDR